MNTVVILGAQINRRKLALMKHLCGIRITRQQRLCGVLMTFCLKNLSICYGPELAHRTIHWAHPCAVSDGARALTQGTCEKRVKGCVASQTGLGSLHHVDVVASDEVGDDRRRNDPHRRPRYPPTKLGQRFFGH